MATTVYGNSTYMAFARGATWDSAEAFCIRRGAHLAAVHSPQVGVVVRQLAEAAAASSNSPNQKCVWLGLRCTPAATGEWPYRRSLCTAKAQYQRWAGGTAVSYDEWAYPQLFNEEWMFQGVECACMFQAADWRWRDDSCTTENPFVCEVQS